MTMQSPRSRNGLTRLLTLILILVFGFLGCIASAWLIHWITADLLARWTSLGTPPGRAVSIQAVAPMSALKKTIVKTADGKYFAYQPGLFPKWVETTWPYPENTVLSPVCSEARPVPPLTRPIIDCKGYFTSEWQDTDEFYAVLDDGSVWRRHYGIGLDKALLLRTLGAAVGIICGFLMAQLIQKNIFKEKA